jgi:hypothetical protein
MRWHYSNCLCQEFKFFRIGKEWHKCASFFLILTFFWIFNKLFIPVSLSPFTWLRSFSNFCRLNMELIRYHNWVIRLEINDWLLNCRLLNMRCVNDIIYRLVITTPTQNSTSSLNLFPFRRMNLRLLIILEYHLYQLIFVK